MIAPLPSLLKRRLNGLMNTDLNPPTAAERLACNLAVPVKAIASVPVVYRPASSIVAPGTANVRCGSVRTPLLSENRPLRPVATRLTTSSSFLP